MDRESYEQELKLKQKEHLKNLQKLIEDAWQPCLHDLCPECVGTGVKKDGTRCIHNISCPCPKCNPRYK